ncbi:hypothetical protein NMY22_g5321 [Coprinellus aureogranulatus]|nr:hypothetical protein NMY22_g5321 [Coprinellus aureogranulatus]
MACHRSNIRVARSPSLSFALYLTHFDVNLYAGRSVKWVEVTGCCLAVAAVAAPPHVFKVESEPRLLPAIGPRAQETGMHPQGPYRTKERVGELKLAPRFLRMRCRITLYRRERELACGVLLGQPRTPPTLPQGHKTAIFGRLSGFWKREPLPDKLIPASRPTCPTSLLYAFSIPAQGLLQFFTSPSLSHWHRLFRVYGQTQRTLHQPNDIDDLGGALVATYTFLPPQMTLPAPFPSSQSSFAQSLGAWTWNPATHHAPLSHRPPLPFGRTFAVDVSHTYKDPSPPGSKRIPARSTSSRHRRQTAPISSLTSFDPTRTPSNITPTARWLKKRRHPPGVLREERMLEVELVYDVDSERLSLVPDQTEGTEDRDAQFTAYNTA